MFTERRPPPLFFFTLLTGDDKKIGLFLMGIFGSKFYFFVQMNETVL